MAILLALGGLVARPVAGAAQAADSAALRERAVRVQADFERERVARLPWAWEGPGGPCDEVVGRFCWRRDGDDDWTPPPEPAAVRAARTALVATLDSIAAAVPGDGWVAAQRVRYRLEAGRPEEAAAVARASRVPAWWRLALEGAALHAAGDEPGAGRAFDAALAAMPAAEREVWTDLRPLLDARTRRAWKGFGPAEREAFARRLWWLADPLWSRPGNGRRAEDLARRATIRMVDGSRTPYDVAWGPDLAELTIRYGWPVGWERTRGGPSALGGGERPAILAHDPPRGRRFVPPGEVLLGGVPADGWPLEVDRPRSTWAPPQTRFVALPHQLAVFDRGAEIEVVGAWDLSADSVAAVDAALVISPGPDGPDAVARRRGAGPAGALAVRAPRGPAVASLEVALPGRAGRFRGGLDPRPAGPGPGVSDVLLLAGPVPLPADLDAAVSRARGSDRIAPGERLGLFWEVYPRGAEAVEITVEIERRPAGGFWRRLGRLFGAGGRAETASLSWREAVEPGARVLPRAVTLAVPDLGPGPARLRISVRGPGGVTRVERVLDVEGRARESARPR